MLKKHAFALSFSAFVFFVQTQSTYAATEITSRAELFGLPFNDLSASRLEKHLGERGLQSYPSYKDGIMNYSLGPEGILGVTNATIFSNTSGYVHQALLSGVVESDQQRQSLGKLLEGKYGVPTTGSLSNGFGKAQWQFDDNTIIELHNATFDVSITYVDEKPRVRALSGNIDVEALSKQ